MKTFLTILSVALFALTTQASAESATYKGTCSYMDLGDSFDTRSHEVSASVDGDSTAILEALNEICSLTCDGNKGLSGCYVSTYSKVETASEETEELPEPDFR